MDRVTVLFLASAVVDAAALCALGLRLAGRRAPRWPVVAALAAAAVGAKLIALRLGGAGRFELIHVVYLDLVVALPLAGLVVLAGGRRGAIRLAAALCVLLAPVGAYATFVEPFRLELERASVPLDRAREGRSAVRVGILADLQTTGVGDHEREAVDRLMAEKPDVILLPGDWFQGTPRRLERELPDVRALGRRLSAPGGVFFVPGDAEQPGYPRRVFEGTSVQVLENEIVRTRVRDRKLAIGGIELNYKSPEALATVRRLEAARGGDLRLLLAHRPDPALDLPPKPRTDLVVAGHTHGGQVQLPLFGPPMVLSRVPRDVGAGGLHDVGEGRRVYISRGVGVEHAGHAPRIRFLCPPEVSILTLRG